MDGGTSGWVAGVIRAVVRLAVLDHRVAALEVKAGIADRSLANLAAPTTVVAQSKEVNQ